MQVINTTELPVVRFHSNDRILSGCFSWNQHISLVRRNDKGTHDEYSCFNSKCARQRASGFGKSNFRTSLFCSCGGRITRLKIRCVEHVVFVFTLANRRYDYAINKMIDGVMLDSGHYPLRSDTSGWICGTIIDLMDGTHVLIFRWKRQYRIEKMVMQKVLLRVTHRAVCSYVYIQSFRC